MAEEVGLKSYIEAFTVASNRARSASILIVIASVLVFSAIWNWSDLGWMDARLHIMRVGLQGCRNEWKAAYLEKLPPEQARWYERARHYLELRSVNPSDCDAIRSMVADLGKARLEENLLVHVPFFGVVIDVNDLGIIGGATFCILLLWLRSSLRRELGNLRLVFLAAPADQQQSAYDLVAMREVLYFPPIRGESAKHKDRRLIVFFYWVPAVLQAVTIITEIVMIRFGWTINRIDLAIDFAGGVIALSVIVRLTKGCVKLSTGIASLWVGKARELGILAKQEAAGGAVAEEQVQVSLIR